MSGNGVIVCTTLTAAFDSQVASLFCTFFWRAANRAVHTRTRPVGLVRVRVSRASQGGEGGGARTLLSTVDVRRRAKLRATVRQPRAFAPLPSITPGAHCGVVADLERVAGARIGAKALGAVLAVLGEPRLLPRALVRLAAASDPAQTRGSAV